MLKHLERHLEEQRKVVCTRYVNHQKRNGSKREELAGLKEVTVEGCQRRMRQRCGIVGCREACKLHAAVQKGLTGGGPNGAKGSAG